MIFIAIAWYWLLKIAQLRFGSAKLSFYVVDPEKFTRALKLLTGNKNCSGAKSITRSGQFHDHLQTYALAFDFSIISKDLILRFFDSVEPQNTKIETILKYEVGFGEFLKKNGVSSEALFKPSVLNRLSGFFWALKFFIWEELIMKRRSCFTMVPLTGINWSHFAANSLAKRYGIAKAELLRQNPYFYLQRYTKGCQPSTTNEILQSIDNSKPYYLKSSSGLSELSSPDQNIEDFILEFIDTPQKQLSTKRVAVVLHLFYIELLNEILSYLDNIIEPFDLYVTTPFAADIPVIIEKCGLNNIPTTVVYSKNKGRDVGPLLRYIAVVNLIDMMLFLRFIQKSLYSQEGKNWRNQLLASLCGSSLVCLSSIDLIRNKKVGVLGPKQFFLSNPRYWGANRTNLINILSNCGIALDENKYPLVFSRVVCLVQS